MMIGDFVVNDTLRIRKGTNASSYGKLFLSFAISAFMHAAGDYGMYGGSRWFSHPFFLAQPVAIILEDIVIAVGNRTGLRSRFPNLSSALGYLWVFSWFCFVMPPFAEAFLPAISSN